MIAVPITKQGPEAGVQTKANHKAARADNDLFSSVYESQMIQNPGETKNETDAAGEVKKPDDQGIHKEMESDEDFSIAAFFYAIPKYAGGAESPENQVLSDPGQVFTAAPGSDGQTDWPVQLQNESVVSILEGNSEGNIENIGPFQDIPDMTPTDQPFGAVPQGKAEGTVARMPQRIVISNETCKPDQVPVLNREADLKPATVPAMEPEAIPAMEPETEPESVLLMAESDDSCPLENKNDITDELIVPSMPEQYKTTDKKEALFSSFGDSSKDDTAGKEKIPHARQTVVIDTEKFASVQNLEKAAAAAPKEASLPVTGSQQTLFDKMVEKIEYMRSDESNQMSIQLKPDYLGKVSIQLSVGDQGLQVKIHAEDLGVKNLISGQINQLAETLAGKGVKVTGIDVVYTGVSGQNSEQSQARQFSQRHNTQRAFRQVRGVGLETLPVTPWEENDISTLDLTVSSVEYRV